MRSDEQTIPTVATDSHAPGKPLISCIMPTAGRPAYVARAVHYFQQQCYPNKELIIVYNKPADMPAMPLPPGIIAVQTPMKIIGAKRNEACRYAQGAIIAQWDDDDIYNTHRLTEQAAPILAGHADVTGLQHFVFYELPTGRCWLPSPTLFSHIFVANVHGGSLVYNRQVWEHLSMYPNFACGEDAGFLMRAIKRGARLAPLHGYNSFVYLRHNSNTWAFEEDNFRRYAGWQPAAMPAWALPHQPFYDNMAISARPLLPPSRNRGGTSRY